MSQSRSSSLASLRNVAVLIFEHYHLSAEHFQSKYDREQVPEIRGLLGCTWTDKEMKSPDYARFPPIICKDDDPNTPSKRFLNPVLFKVRIYIDKFTSTAQFCDRLLVP